MSNYAQLQKAKAGLEYNQLLNSLGFSLARGSFYLGARIPGSVRCSAGHVFSISPTNFKSRIKNPKDCPVCKNATASSAYKDSLKSKFLEKLVSNGESLANGETYRGYQKRHNVLCSKGHLYTTIPKLYTIKTNATNCSICNPKSNFNAKIDFEKHVYERGYSFKENGRPYVNNKSVVDLICPFLHDYAVEASAFKNRGDVCARCTNRSPAQAKENFIKNTLQRKYTVENIEDYVNASTNNMVLRCDKNHLYTTNAGTFAQGYGCPKCGKVSPEQAEESFLKNLSERNYRLKTPGWLGASCNYSIICPQGHSFDMTPGNFKAGQSCTECTLHGVSKAELELLEYIKSIEPNALGSVKGLLTKKPKIELDIYIPNLKIGFEYCGLYFHSETLNTDNVERHEKKYQLFLRENIRLVTIFEDEWIVKKEQVKGYIKAILGKVKNRVGARKTELRKVPHKEAWVFHEQNHLQGSGRGGNHYGLYYDNALVSLATFLPIGYNIVSSTVNHKNIVDLARFTNKIGWSVSGGLERLIQNFIKENSHVELIISYSDNRWSVGTLYNNNGFIQADTSLKTYTYWHPNKWKKEGRRNRASFKKKHIAKIHPNMDWNKTEWELMRDLGYDRIWDCGKIRWERKVP